MGFEFEVGDVAQVSAFSHGAKQSLFVNDVLTGGVDEDGSFTHGVNQVISDAAASGRCGGHVKADDVVVFKECASGFHDMIAGIDDALRIVERRVA